MSILFWIGLTLSLLARVVSKHAATATATASAEGSRKELKKKKDVESGVCAQPKCLRWTIPEEITAQYVSPSVLG